MLSEQEQQSYNLNEKYDNELKEAIREFSDRYNSILSEAEIEKKVFIKKIAGIIANNFQEVGTLDIVKNDIASIVITIVNQHNISISEDYIVRVLKPLGYTNIRSRKKTDQELKTETRTIRDANSSIIYCNNVTKDISTYKNNLMENTINCYNDLELHHFDELEIEKLRELSIQFYNRTNNELSQRKKALQQEQEVIEQIPQTPNEQEQKESEQKEEEGKEETMTEEEAEELEEQEEEVPETKETLTSELLYNKIDSPRDKLPFRNEMAEAVKELENEHKIMSKNLRKFYTITLKYPEYDPQKHKEHVEAIKSQTFFMQCMNMIIKPYINLKYRRDSVGWVELHDLSEEYTEGTACSRSRVPARYYDKYGKLVETQRKLTKEHITENLPYAKKLKKALQNVNAFVWSLNQYYLNNIQTFTNGFAAKYHNTMSNSS